MRKRQPFHQLSRGFFGSFSVERHHRRRKARRAAELRAPSVADGSYLDLVRPPADDFLVAMNRHSFSMSGVSEAG